MIYNYPAVYTFFDAFLSSLYLYSQRINIILNLICMQSADWQGLRMREKGGKFE